MFDQRMSSMSAFSEKIQGVLNVEIIRNILFKSGYNVLDFGEIKEKSGLEEEFRIKFKINWPDIGVKDYFIFVRNFDVSIEDILNEERFFDSYIVPGSKYTHQFSSGIREINIFTDISEDPILLFHKQIKIVSLFSGYADLVRDNNAFILKDLEWVKDVALNQTPPSPRHLYMVHNVFDNKKSDKISWLHTHGLQGCGIDELEFLDVKEKYDSVMRAFLESISSCFIENGQPNSGEEFHLGDGVRLCAFSRQEALQKLGKVTLGGIEDRKNSYDDVKSNVILVKKKKFFGLKTVYKSPQIYGDRFFKNPVSFYSDKESDRMTNLALEKFSIFKELLKQYKNDENWQFLVKIGIETEIKKYTNYEHLRFEVEEISGDKIKGKLINSPYFIPSISKGNVYSNDINKISGWKINTVEFGQYDPDTIYLLGKKMFYSK